MATFTALNLEPEDDSEEEIDDTKELQLEEAFKLYQNALKLHSQGPSSYAQAIKAYQELFQSEVFRYPEVLSEFAKDELDTTSPEAGNLLEALPPSTGQYNVADKNYNSLPLLVHLSYKNSGQFALDYVHRTVADES